MKMGRSLGRRLGVCILLGAWLAAPALALDAKTVRDIERADSAEKLASLAAEIASDAATRQPKDVAEGTRIAAETSSYLLYIIAKQNALLIRLGQADRD